MQGLGFHAANPADFVPSGRQSCPSGKRSYQGETSPQLQME